MLREENGVYSFDWDKLKATAKKAVHFLDNVIDANKYPLKEIDFMTKQTRKVGLGVMGWADALLRLKIPYNSEQAVRLAETVMRAVTEAGREESRELAKAAEPSRCSRRALWIRSFPSETLRLPQSPRPEPCRCWPPVPPA